MWGYPDGVVVLGEQCAGKGEAWGVGRVGIILSASPVRNAGQNGDLDGLTLRTVPSLHLLRLSVWEYYFQDDQPFCHSEGALATEESLTMPGRVW